MSKQTEAKAAQGYGKRHCLDCKHYTQTKAVSKKWPYYDAITGRKCTIGGFAVQAQYSCNMWEASK